MRAARTILFPGACDCESSDAHLALRQIELKFGKVATTKGYNLTARKAAGALKESGVVPRTDTPVMKKAKAEWGKERLRQSSGHRTNGAPTCDLILFVRRRNQIKRLRMLRVVLSFSAECCPKLSDRLR